MADYVFDLVISQLLKSYLKLSKTFLITSQKPVFKSD